MRYDTILFDSDNTLLDFSRSEHEAISDCLSANGQIVSEYIIDRYSEINHLHWRMLERGEIKRSELYSARFVMLCEEFNLNCDPVRLSNDYISALTTKAYLINGAYELCEKLSKTCRLYLITNGNAQVQHGRFDTCPIARFFQKTFISEEVGFAKPDIRYFNAVAAEIPSFNALKTLVVGDSLTSDIAGGNNASLATCWYNPHREDKPDNIEINHIAYDFDDIFAYITAN